MRTHATPAEAESHTRDPLDNIFYPQSVAVLGVTRTPGTVFRDVTFALAPIRPSAAARMVREIKAHSLLEGARGTGAGVETAN